MEKTMQQHHLLAFLCISFLLDLTIQVAADSPRYDPADSITLDCGSPGDNYNGRTWIGDINSPKYSPIKKTNTSFPSDAKKPPTSLEAVPYSKARVSTSEFTYSFPVTRGPKFVRLYFYPTHYQNFIRDDAFFTVKSGSFTLLNNFSAALVADSLGTEGFAREFCVLVEKSQVLNLTFMPNTSHPNAYAFINGIEVVSMPDDLYYKPVVGTDDSSEGIKFIGQSNVYPHSNIRALELIRRLNVGGKAVDAAADTGMYRMWEDDTEYLSSQIRSFCWGKLQQNVKENRASKKVQQIFGAQQTYSIKYVLSLK